MGSKWEGATCRPLGGAVPSVQCIIISSSAHRRESPGEAGAVSMQTVPPFWYSPHELVCPIFVVRACHSGPRPDRGPVGDRRGAGPLCHCRRQPLSPVRPQGCFYSSRPPECSTRIPMATACAPARTTVGRRRRPMSSGSSARSLDAGILANGFARARCDSAVTNFSSPGHAKAVVSVPLVSPGK